MGESGLVSIIMPSYNTGNYIGDSIKSILKQTYEKWELIIIDDASTDNTDEIVFPFLSDNRIRYIKNKFNEGAAISRNTALKAAKGKWIAFLDSDDLWKRDKLTKQIAFMERKQISFSYTEYNEIDENGMDTGVTVSGPTNINRRKMFNYCWPGCLTVMYNADEIGLVQIKDVKKNNDYAIWLKICKKSDCYLLKEVLAEYRKGRSGSISSHSIRSLIIWHYKLFRIAEEQTIFLSILSTFRNLFWGIVKKIKYVEKRNT